MLQHTHTGTREHECHAPAIFFCVSPELHRFDTCPGTFPTRRNGDLRPFLRIIRIPSPSILFLIRPEINVDDLSHALNVDVLA